MAILSYHDALRIGLESIEMRADLPPKTKCEAKEKLEKLMRKEPYIQWDEDSIIAALTAFKERNGFAPTVTNLTESGMPKALTIQTYFHMKPSAFLHRLFPETAPDLRKRHKRTDLFQTPEEWLSCFREQFNKHKEDGVCCRKYNQLRDRNTPGWETIAKACGVGTWTALMEKAGVSYPCRPGKQAAPLYIQSVRSPYLETMKQLNEEYSLVTAELRALLGRVE